MFPLTREPFQADRVGLRHADGSPLDEQTEVIVSRVIGAALTVHRALGPGYLEAMYEEALAIELAEQNIAFQRQFPFEVKYRGRIIGQGRLDLLVEDRVVVELKAVESMTALFKAQTISYLHATGKQVALLINFNIPLLKDGIKRILL